MKNFFKQLFTVICSVAVVAYVILQLSLTADTQVDTEYAFYEHINETVEAEAFIFRDEIPLRQSVSGARSYLAANGEKVSIAQPLCTTYENENDATLQEQINDIDRQINILKHSNIITSSFSTDLAKTNAAINENMMAMQRAVAAGDLQSAARYEDELLIQMNRREAIVADSKDFYGSRINDLERQRYQLKLSQSGTGFTSVATTSGYFYSDVDGYEKIFTVSALESITANKLKALSETVPDEALSADCLGKLSPTSKWYIAFTSTKRIASNFDEGEKYKVIFPFSDGLEIEMRFERTVSSVKEEEAVLVFSTHVLAEGFNFSRKQNVKVVHSSKEGLKIRTSTLRYVNGKTGVYTLSASQKVVFKTVDIISESDGFYLVSLPDPTDRTYRDFEKLSLNDVVILGGKDLYEGKVLQ